MSYEVPIGDPELEARKRFLGVFLREFSTVLDESVPFPRRAAMLRKWTLLLAPYGVKPAPEDMDSSELQRYAEQVLSKLKEIVRVLGGGYG